MKSIKTMEEIKKPTFVEKLLLNPKFACLQKISITDSDSFYEASRIIDFVKPNSSEPSLTMRQKYKLEILKYYVEESSIIICNLLEGYLPKEKLTQKAERLNFYMTGLKIEAKPNAVMLHYLFNWYEENDGAEEVTALIYLACELAKSDSGILDFIKTTLSISSRSLRSHIIEALKWTDNQKIENCLVDLKNGHANGLINPVDELLYFRKQTTYPVKIPFYYGE